MTRIYAVTHMSFRFYSTYISLLRETLLLLIIHYIIIIIVLRDSKMKKEWASNQNSKTIKLFLIPQWIDFENWTLNKEHCEKHR